MRRRLVAALLLALCLVLPMAVQAEEYAEVARLVRSMQAFHETRHTLETLTIQTGEGPFDCLVPQKAPSRLMACMQLQYSWVEGLPTTLAEVGTRVGDLYDLALTITDFDGAPTVVSLDSWDGEVAFSAPPEIWWKVGEDATGRLLAVPVMCMTPDSYVVDGAVYMVIFFENVEDSGVWLCADQDIVEEMLHAFIPDELPDDAASLYLEQWLTEGRS